MFLEQNPFKMLCTSSKNIIKIAIFSFIAFSTIIFLILKPYPLILSTDPNFIKFKNELSPKIYKYLDNDYTKFTENQRKILLFNKSDVVDIYVIKNWNMLGSIYNNTISSIADGLGSITKKITGKNIEEFTKKIKDGSLNTILNITMTINSNYLNLSGIHLSRIPINALNFFEELNYLVLSSTKTKNGIEKLSKLPNLRTLDIGKNEISEFPNFSEFMQLTKVILDFNPIKKIDFSDKKMGKIKEISIKNIEGLEIVNYNELIKVYK